MESTDRSSPGDGRDRSQRLIDVGTTLLSELDLESVLRSVVEAARELTGAEYAALGVLDRDRKELERFIYLGIDDETRRAIGNLPRGRGLLGELIREPSPLRLRDVNQHPHAYGFPPGHPPMHSFLGVPITIRGEAYGNLYMTEKRGAEEFDEADERSARTLATWAGIAIENARLYTSLSEREAEVEQALRQAETSVDIARAVGGEIDVARVLDLIVKRARALVEAKTLLVLLRRGDRLVLAAQAGEVGPEVEQLTIPTEDAVFQAAMQERVAQHLKRGSPPSEARLRERVGAEAALVVPLLFRGRAVGALVALDREAGGDEFDEEDLRLLESFAASAATAVATAQTVESERLQQRMEVGENERQRWARELHDETLQGLAAIRISLATALQSKAPDRPEKIAAAAVETVNRLEGQINELSRLINDLRPASLERLGLAGALLALAEEAEARGGLEVTAEIELEGELSGEEERVIYRLVQEALNNVVKHAAATHATLEAKLADGVVRIVVGDDGTGFDAAPENEG
ncbi:MAG TPA: GAF domain-containing protein, partial [Solirubrobacterales bacterium]|nr:GAF domain-containing protein [Solirubrobacterales bacterium]